MADIQFDEEQQYGRYLQTEQKPFLIRLVLATNIVSTDRAAEYVLVGFVLLGLLISVFFFTRGGSPAPPPASQIIWVAGPDARPGR